MEKIFKRTLAVLLSFIMVFGAFSIGLGALFAKATTFNDINQSSVFIKQGTTGSSGTCTLASAVMLVRRAAMANGNTNWANITESTMKSTAWKTGAGLYYNFTYAGISVGHANLPGGSSNTQTLINLLAEHPEGIMIYDTGIPHAILLTDYTNGVFYCVDPSPAYPSGRINISEASVKIVNADTYWYVKSPKITLDEDNPNIPEKPVITDVVNNNNGTVTIKWTACERANAYSLRFYKPGETERIVSLIGITRDTKYTYELPNGTYTVKVTAEGDGCWRDSEMSSEFTIAEDTPEKPIITSITTNQNGTATVNWTECANAVSYSIRFYDSNSLELIKEFYCVTSNTSYECELPIGTYLAMVSAEGKRYWRNSTLSDQIKITNSSVTSIQVTILTPSATSISYGDAIILHVDESKIPAGGRVEWTASNGNFDLEPSADGTTCKLYPSSSGDTTITATVYDANGNEISSSEQEMTSKAGFFDKLIAFFKKLFGLTKTIAQAYNKIEW